MKTVLSVVLIAICSGLLSVPALAENRIELYSDTNRASCAISEPVSPPIVQVHVFITGTRDVTGVRFRAPKPDCWVGATWLGDLLPTGYGMIGNSQTDWSVAFGRCVSVTPAAYVGAISYLISGQASACCEVKALPAIQYVITDCSPNFPEYPLEQAKPLIVNPDNTCGCQGGLTTAVEPSTWGQVKALYR
jgi:hypothetical protein